MTDKEKEKQLELGDIIIIDVPTNPEWHQHIFFVSYIDTEIIILIHTQTSFSYILNRQESNEIKKIMILNLKLHGVNLKLQEIRYLE